MNIGTQFELDFRGSSGSARISHRDLQTVRDLLEAIKEDRIENEKTIPMLGSTLTLVSAIMARPVEAISIRDLEELKPRLEAYLKSRGYKRHSVRSYLNYRRILLRAAEKLGWVRLPQTLPQEWETVLQHLPKDKNYRAVAVYAASKKKGPSDLTDSDLEDWLQAAISQGRSFRYARDLKGCFRNRIFRLGLAAYFPNLPLRPTESYGLPLCSLPERLRTQVSALLEWMIAPISFGRGRNSQLRPVSAKHLKYFICRIAGFVLIVKNEKVSCLEDLLTRERFASYVAWCVNCRHVRPGPFAATCGVLYAALRRYFPNKEFDWMPELIADLPSDSYTVTQQNKNRKWVDWSELALIPNRIRDDANRRYKGVRERYACAVSDQLLIQWLLVMPWRQRNLRECKLLPSEQGGNLVSVRRTHVDGGSLAL